MTNKKNGFTLVELLAVIVILAVILVIAVPQIMNVITESRKGALASSAKLIASSAETAYISNQTLGIEKNIECRDISNYTEEDYASCKIKFVDGKAKVKIIGQGKFEGMAVCSGTKEDATVVEECPLSAAEKIESLAVTGNTEGLELTSDGNIRYTGEKPKNYINFNDELWRIIGIFNMTTSSGSEETLLKIVRNSPFSTKMSWDSSASNVNNGWGVNQWGEVKDVNGNIVYQGADLMTMLNKYYIGEPNSQCNYCNGGIQSECLSDCSNFVTPIKSTYRKMVENVVWNTGALEYDSNGIPVLTAYNAERETRAGKECTSGDRCNDTVTRTTTWTGKVGLIYPSDYGFASTSGCRSDIINDSRHQCDMYNWIHLDPETWTISPSVSSSGSMKAWHVGFIGYASSGVSSTVRVVRPSLYLKSDVSITSGEGTESSPYQISMN